MKKMIVKEISIVEKIIAPLQKFFKIYLHIHSFQSNIDFVIFFRNGPAFFRE